MMRKILFLLLAAIVFAGSAAAQKLPKPQQTPQPDTPAQTKTIREGIELHDAKKYAEAIAKYQSVLDENPHSTFAMYEIALSHFSSGNKAKAKEVALRGAGYISDELPLFYLTIANVLDDEGKSNDAIKLYRDAENILRGYPDLRRHLASVQYNLAVTYFRQKKYAEARIELKKAVESNFSYASPHLLLSVVFEGTKYKVPALLAAARLISLEPNTQRAKRAAEIFTGILKPAAKDPATGNINIFLNLDAPKDEGDFGMFDLILGTVTIVRGDDDKGKSDNQMFVEGIGTVIAILAEDKKIGSTFVGKTYVPFMTELKKSGHLDAFGNIVLYVNDNTNADAGKWIDANGAKVQAFLDWAKAYRLPVK